MVFPTMRVPCDRPPHAPGGSGGVLVVGPVNLGLGALATPLTCGLAVHPTA